MLITGILISIWLILFDRNYTFLFSIYFIVVLMMEIYIDFVIISTYWFRRHNRPLNLWPLKFSRENTFERSNLPLQNSIRRLMFLKIQNLFRNPVHHSDNKNCSLFDYRCPICLNNKQHSFRWIVLGCGHILCSFCIQHLYFGTKPICPNCRSSIILSDLTILYI